MENMKVRIGYGLGVRTTLNDTGFLDVVDTLERLRFDSLWLSERIGGDAPDPLVAMAMAAARTTRLKVGMSVMVLPGRNPIVLAKELATLDRMSNGRLLPAFGLGAPREQRCSTRHLRSCVHVGWMMKSRSMASSTTTTTCV